MAIHRFAFPTTIHFGPGARREVAPYLRAQGCQRPLIVTDKGIAALPMLAEFKSSLKNLAVAVYAGVAGNPVKSQVDAGVEAYKAHHADSVIGFGGGAALDVAKAVALMYRSANKSAVAREVIASGVLGLHTALFRWLVLHRSY